MRRRMMFHDRPTYSFTRDAAPPSDPGQPRKLIASYPPGSYVTSQDAAGFHVFRLDTARIQGAGEPTADRAMRNRIAEINAKNRAAYETPYSTTAKVS